MTKQEVLQQCTTEGNVVKLPNVQLDRNEYLEVKKALELIGGKWKGGKVSGFVFQEDPTEYLEQIANGEQRNLKKEFQFFATPDELADRLVGFANPKIDDIILEPSAGQGAIIKAIHRFLGIDVPVYAFELMPLNQSFLEKIVGVRLLGSDFLRECDTQFNIIIANPPFAKNQDIEHIQKMYDQLSFGGRLVSIASNHWRQSQNKKETQFREWLDECDHEVHEIDAGAFKDSGTMVGGCIVIIDK